MASANQMKFLVIQKDEAVLQAVAVALQMQWPDASVISARTADAGLNSFFDQEPDVVVVEAVLPGKSGLVAVKEIRSISEVPIVILVDRDDETSLIKGLEMGADQYLTKPLRPLELLARVRAVLRRRDPTTSSAAFRDFVAGDLRVDFQNERVTLRGEPVNLTAREYKLLFHLVRNAGRLLPHQALVDWVWGEAGNASAVELTRLVGRLRTKIESNRDAPRFIENYRGVGYWFNHGHTQGPADSG